MDRQDLLNELNRVRSQLRDAREDAWTDELTQLGNRRRLAYELAQWMDSGDPFGVILFDVANLKPVNDRLGHPAGDRLLAAAADSIRAKTDSVAVRYGGDEFVVLVDGGLRAAERVRTRIELAFGYSCEIPERSTFLTGGCALWTEGVDTETVLLDASRDMERRKSATKRELGEPTTRE